MRDGFGTYHPLANLIFFTAVMAMAMVTDDPVIVTLSLVGAVIYAVQLKGRRGAVTSLKGALPVIVFTAVLNPLFNHAGVTPLFYMPSGNAVTLEAIAFGIGAGVKLASMVMWFYCLNHIFTGDKIIYLFGKISPYFALALSLILGFVPVIKNKFRMCYASQGQFCKNKLVTASRCLIATAGWAIEEAADTAESMHGRGFGLKGRTSFTLFRMERKDMAFMAVCGTAFIILIIFNVTGAFDFYYYPYVKSFGNGMRLCGALLYAFVCLMPAAVYLRERRGYK